MNLDGCRILITGGAGGIGRSLVEGFLNDGALVGVIEKDVLICTNLENEFLGRIATWACDVSNPEDVDRTLGLAQESGFEWDVLINNAGIIHSEPLVNIAKKSDRVHSNETWRLVMASDLDSVFYVSGKVVENMIQRRCKGVVISISSICANGNPGQSAYSAAKAGVNALTRTWAKELGTFGIRFAAIAPGFIDTPSTRGALSESKLALLQKQIPLRSLGSTHSIYLAARAIVENEYINGTIIEVDGGLTI